ncbi:MAG: flagellar assembly protein FliW [Paenibacillaceae bacterium]
MIVNTASFGILEIDPQDVYTFPHGIPGFEGNMKYIIVQPDPSMPFCYFQSVEESSLTLLVCNPFLFFLEYDFQLSDANQQELNITDAVEVAVWSVVTIDKDKNGATMNLLAPIVVNVQEKRGKQVILHDSNYSIKHKMSFPETDEAIITEG